MKTSVRLSLFSLAVCSVTCAVQPLQAAIPFFNLQPAQTVSGDSDVRTDGTLVNAFNLGSAAVGSVTVNGVAFQPLGFPTFPTTVTNNQTSGNFTFSESAGFLASDDNLANPPSAPFSGLGLSYRALLTSGGGTTEPATLSLTVNGLQPGQDYLLQFWVSQSTSPFSTFGLIGGSIVATSGPSTQVLDMNTSNAAGGMGQFVVGTMTAISPFVTLTFNGTGGTSPFLNAFQLRAIPEPSSCVLAGLGLLILLRRSRSLKALSA